MNWQARLLLMIGAAAALAPANAEPPALRVPFAAATPGSSAQASDPAWSHAALISQLSLCVGPQSAGVAATPTQVQSLWDAQDFYVRFTCEQRAAGPVYEPSPKASGDLSSGDVCEVFVDPVGDAREFIELQIAPSGRAASFVYLLTGAPASDASGVLTSDVLARDSWTIPAPAWRIDGLRVAAHADATGRRWIVDIALPAAALLRRLGRSRFAAGTRMRVNFVRYDHPAAPSGERADVFMNWAPVAWGRPHHSPQAAGTITLVEKAETTP